MEELKRKRTFRRHLLSTLFLISAAFLIGSAFVVTDHKEVQKCLFNLVSYCHLFFHIIIVYMEHFKEFAFCSYAEVPKLAICGSFA